MDGLDLFDTEAALCEMDLDQSVEPVSHLYRGGASAAKGIFESFIDNRFGDYVEHRNQPQTDDVSHISKYLHYGHVSPVYLVLETKKAGAGQDDIDSYLEELVVRRELSISFQIYNNSRVTVPCPAD